MEDKEYYGFIYITTNHINNKKYIGQKKYNNNWKTYLGSGVLLSRAIKKYGKENFSKEIIENCYTKEQLNEREKFWIKYYKAVTSDDFYNLASGGDGGNIIGLKTDEEKRKIYGDRDMSNMVKGEQSPFSKLKNDQVVEISYLIMDGFSNQYIAEKFNVSSRTISDIKLKKTWKSITLDFDFDNINYRPYQAKSNKPVIQYDKDGNYIKEWLSARQIDEVLGISYKQISQCCNGDRKTSHGYVWRFKGDSFEKYYK